MFGAALQAIPLDLPPLGDRLPLPPMGTLQQRIWETLDQTLS